MAGKLHNNSDNNVHPGTPNQTANIASLCPTHYKL